MFHKNLENNVNFENDQITSDEVEELSFSDKLVGVFSEPAATFESISKFPVRTIDWLVPVLIACLILVAGNVVRMTNPEIKQVTMETMRDQQEKQYTKQVKEGKITQEQVDKQLDQTEKMMGSQLYIVLGSVGAFVGFFIFFFIFAGIYFLFGKFAFNGTGTFLSTLPVLGLSQLIGTISTIIGIILSVVYGKNIGDASLSGLINYSQINIYTFLFGLLDVFMIWATFVQSIGLSKMFKTKSYIPFLIVGLVIFVGLKYLGYMALN